MANLKLERIDAWCAERHELVGTPERYTPTRVAAAPRLKLDLTKAVAMIVWVTGFRPDYSWLNVPIFPP